MKLRLPQASLLLGSLVGLCCGSVILTSDAFALAPLESDQVESARFLTLANVFRTDEETAFLGLKECQSAVRSDNPIRAEFVARFTLSPTIPGAALGFDGLYTFEVPASMTSGSVDCIDADSNICTKLGTDNFELSEQTLTTTTEFTFQDLTNIKSEQECDNGLEQEYFIRFSVEENNLNGGSDDFDSADLKLVIDTIPPTEPQSFDAVITETKTQVSWQDEQSGAIRGYVVVFSKDQFEGGKTIAELQETNSDLRQRSINDNSDNSGEAEIDLPPNEEVWIGLAAQDDAGNTSAVISPTKYTVLDTTDFWEQYRAAGGQEDGGYCQSTSQRPASSPFALALLALLLGFGPQRVRRRRD